MKKNKGFTLIELLVVMAIIAVLAALSLTGLGAARKAARDTARKSDLAQYRSALESYATSNNLKYPEYHSINYPLVLNDGNRLGTYLLCFTNADDPSYPYRRYYSIMYDKVLPFCPVDPKATSSQTAMSFVNCSLTTYQYCYIPFPIVVWNGLGPQATEYYMTAKLEGGDFWAVCSNGKAGKVAITYPMPARCPVQ